MLPSTARFAALVLLFVSAFFAPRVASADDPALEYRTIETPHFWVHYHTGTEALARRVAVLSEQAHADLAKSLQWSPSGRTHVIVNDKVDTANGSATVFGRRVINVYGMAPESDSVLGFYDDWMRVLVYHEYVHILQLDTMGGLPPLVNMLIGKQWVPGQTLPRWYIEGLATYFESAYTRGGRVDSSLYKMYLRAAALEGSFFDLGQATGLPVEWPSGGAAYLYGGFFLNYVFEKHGEDFAAAFNHIYGRRILPWSLNSISNKLTGETFDELWKEWAADEAGAAHAARVANIARGGTKMSRVTERGGNSGFAKLRPQTNEIWFYEFDHEQAPTYSSVLSNGKDRTRQFEVEAGAGPFAFTPDGKTLVFSQSTTLKGTYRYLDLFARDLERNSTRRLTWGERAREPAISPDGKRLVYVRNVGGTMELVVRSYTHPSGPSRVLVGGAELPEEDQARWQQIATPVWAPDSRQLVFSWWRQDDGQRDLWIIDVDSGELRRMTNDFAVDMDPNWSQDGRIYFASDRTGAYNIYALDPESGAIQQRSDVVTGVFAPSLAADERTMFVTTYGAAGFDIARFPLEEARPAPPSVIDELERREYPEISEEFEDRKYAPGRYLGPLRLVPQLGVVTGGAGAGATLSGNDPISRHIYSLTAGYTTGRELTDRSANAALGYSYTGLPVGISASTAFRQGPRSRELYAENQYIPFIRRQVTGRLALSYTFREILDSVSITASYEVDHTEFANVPEINHDPADLEPSYPQLGWFNELGVRLSYSAVDAYPRSVTSAKGWRGFVSLGVMDPALGSDFQNITFGYGFDLFLQNPLFPRHTLALLLDGALTISELDIARRYSVGGNSPQDVFTSIVLQQQRSSFVIRGHEPGATSGSRYQVAQLAYRFPILDLDEGFATLPVFLRQIRGSVFLDHGGAYSGFYTDADLLTGAGAEVILESVFGYYIFGNLRLGYARGLGPLGINEFYALFGGGF